MIERVIGEARSDIAEHERKQMARQVVFDILGMIAFGFLQKLQAVSVASSSKGILPKLEPMQILWVTNWSK